MAQKTAFPSPSLEEARELFEAAVRVKELAPWEWMDEADVFGVQNPEQGELGFVSVMGMAGEHFAVTVYRGAEGLYAVMEFASAEVVTNPEQLLDIPQLQASFESRDQLDKQDRDLIKKLGLKFRGASAWPLFRSYSPGLMPWFVTAEEARFLTHALWQTLEVAPRVRDNPELLYAEAGDNGDDDDETYLVRVAREEAGSLVWEDRWMRVPPPERQPITVVLDAEVLGHLKQLPQQSIELELDLLSLPTAIGEKGERPYRPYMLMLADGESGMIVGFELMQPKPSLEQMRMEVPLKLAEWLAQAGVVPAEITVRSTVMAELLGHLAQTLGIRLSLSEELPGVDAAAESMFGMLGGLF